MPNLKVFLRPVTVLALIVILCAMSMSIHAQQPKIVLRVGTGDSGDGLIPHNEIITRFEADNPDILVQIEPVAGTDYYAELFKQLEAETAPDIIQIGDDAVPSFVLKGALVPLDDYITGTKGDAKFDTSVYLPGLLNPGQWDGKQYLLPKDFSPLAVYYNKKLFDEYKVPYPKEGWTWDDFLQTAKALTKDTDGDGNTDVWGVQLPASWPTGFEYWIASAGGQLIDPTGKTFKGYFDSDAVAKAVQFYGDLYNKDKVAPPPADMSQFAGGNTEFADGKAAMRLFGRWPQSELRTNENVSLGVIGVPQAAKRANVLFWGGFGITSRSKNQDAAWRFLSYYTGPKAAEVWKNWGLPTVQKVAEVSGLTKDPIEGVWLNELNYLAPRAYTFTSDWGSTAEPALRKVLEKVIIDGNTDVPATLQRAAEDAQAALDKAASK